MLQIYNFQNVFLLAGNWGAWSNYSDCSVSCGGEGTQIRTRLCNNPAPQNGGANCSGTDTNSQTCNNGACPPVGKYCFNMHFFHT